MHEEIGKVRRGEHGGRDRRRRRDLKAVRRWDHVYAKSAPYAFYVAYFTSGVAYLTSGAVRTLPHPKADLSRTSLLVRFVPQLRHRSLQFLHGQMIIRSMAPGNFPRPNFRLIPSGPVLKY